MFCQSMLAMRMTCRAEWLEDENLLFASECKWLEDERILLGSMLSTRVTCCVEWSEEGELLHGESMLLMTMAENVVGLLFVSWRGMIYPQPLPGSRTLANMSHISQSAWR